MNSEKNQNDNAVSSCEPSGVLVINKPKGPTSHDIVNKIRHLYGTRRVGHTGTLDPMATGVLVVLVGRAAKAAEYLVSDTKKYRATLRLGITTDTQDITGTVLSRTENPLPAESEVIKECMSFVGKSEQIPPMYSALKVGGKKLLDLARKGEIIERNAKPIEIFSISCKKANNVETDYILEATVSSGTYIRTLCHDIGENLSCGAAMASLERLETGGFGIDKAYNTDELEKMSYEQRISLLTPIKELFSCLSEVKLPAFYEKLCRSGCEIYLSKIKEKLSVGEKVKICNAKGDFFALGLVSEYPDGIAIKAIKTFVL